MNEEDMPSCVQEDPSDLLTFEKIVSFNIYEEESVPDSFDWRDHNVVSPVTNRGTCGSCWPFAATGIEMLPR
ncbi:cathepsin L [Trifolium repens]|nr:cathepsin L [Trifolium repens]